MEEKVTEGFFAAELLALRDEDLESVWQEGIEMIKAIQDHFKDCAECREDFDAMAYRDFDEFEKILSNTPLSEWICEKAEGDYDIKTPDVELLVANEILGITSNLDDADDAIEYARLYIKAMHEAAKIAGEEYEFDEAETYRLIAETDTRFEEEVSE